MLDPDISTAGALHHLSRPEPASDEDVVAGELSRRHFLQLVGMGLGAGLVAGPGTSLLDQVIPGHDPSAWAAGPVGPGDGILVVIGMYGGNDGLNTIVPITDGNYYTQHGDLALQPGETQRLDSSTGLHPDLTEVKRFWDAGQLAIVEGVGHTIGDDFSHFSSMARWMAGYRTLTPSSGWVGRWLDGYLGGSKDLYAAAEIGRSLPLHMIGNSSAATVVPTGPPAFGVPREWRTAADQSLFRAIRDMSAGSGGWHARVGGAQVDQLDIAAQLSTIIPEPGDEPEIVQKLGVAARLINANLGFRVITAGWGDFDSHAGQPQMHTSRMLELNLALQRFFGLLHPDWGNRVTVMTFSEFGRTSFGNASAGSDHGSSAAQLVFGAKVRGGFYGQRPSLAGLRRWDRMPTHVSHADYFGSVLDGWMGGAGSVLPDYRENLGLFTGPPDAGRTFPGFVFGEFVPVNPVRVYDSRSATGGRAGRIGPDGVAKVGVRGVAGIPDADDVSAVAVNLTSIRPSRSTYLTGYPSGQSLPTASSVNPRVGQILPNMAVLGLGPDGAFDVFNKFGDVHMTVDVAGYFRRSGTAKFLALDPARVLDTRDGTGIRRGRVRGGQRFDLRVTGQGGVPNSGVNAVILNLTAIRPTRPGWITAWPKGSSKPLAASLSFRIGEIVPNMVMAAVGDDGSVSFEASDGDVDLVADVVGCFTDSTGSALASIAPFRLLDTRDGTGAPQARLGPGRELVLSVGGRGGVPLAASAAVINIAGIRASEQTFLTVYPDGASRPLASTLNPQAGQINGNLTVARLGNGGRIRIYNERGTIELIADATGFFA